MTPSIAESTRSNAHVQSAYPQDMQYEAQSLPATSASAVETGWSSQPLVDDATAQGPSPTLQLRALAQELGISSAEVDELLAQQPTDEQIAAINQQLVADMAASSPAAATTSQSTGAGWDASWEQAFAEVATNAGASPDATAYLLEDIQASNLDAAQLGSLLEQLSTETGTAAIQELNTQIAAQTAAQPQSPIPPGLAKAALIGAGVFAAYRVTKSVGVKALTRIAQNGTPQAQETARAALSTMKGSAAQKAREALLIGSGAESATTRATASLRAALQKQLGTDLPSKVVNFYAPHGQKLDDVARELARQRGISVPWPAGMSRAQHTDAILTKLLAADGIKLPKGATTQSMAVAYAKHHGTTVSSKAAGAAKTVASTAKNVANAELTAMSKATSMLRHPVDRFRLAATAASVGPAADAMRVAGGGNLLSRGAKIGAGFSAEMAAIGGAKGLGSTALGAFKGKAGLFGVALGAAFEAPKVIQTFKEEGGFGVKTSKATGRAVGNVAGGVAGWVVGAKVGGVAGAAIGTAIFPGVGTAIGAGAGALIGGLAGSTLGTKIAGPIGDAVGGAVHGLVSGIGDLF